mmetsp:Transcript_100443/g.189432  ORF Transcript_100443/g.189432 Transcript_100443/m.189432 type:complete len:141 (+) Transcript_100443:86-508(+)
MFVGVRYLKNFEFLPTKSQEAIFRENHDADAPPRIRSGLHPVLRKKANSRYDEDEDSRFLRLRFLRSGLRDAERLRFFRSGVGSRRLSSPRLGLRSDGWDLDRLRLLRSGVASRRLSPCLLCSLSLVCCLRSRSPTTLWK